MAECYKKFNELHSFLFEHDFLKVWPSVQSRHILDVMVTEAGPCWRVPFSQHLVHH